MNWYSSMPTVPHFDFVAYNVRHLVKGLRDLDKGVEMKSISEATEKSDKPKLSRKQRRRQNRGDVFDMVEGQFKEQHDE